MRTVVSVASVLCAFSLDAQITTTFNRLPDGLDEVRIRNNLLRRTHSPARGMDGPEDEGPPAATLEASYNHHQQHRKASLPGPPSEMSRHDDHDDN
jgi:hypothetical protein